WRADGSQLVYHDGAVDRLFVLDGTSGAILAPAAPVITAGDARNPSWSPISDLIAYDDGASIGFIHFPSNILEPVSFPGTDPDWSPDGHGLVYSVQVGTGTSIRVRDALNVGPETELVPAQGFQNFGAKWSPNGQWIAFSTNRPSGTDYNVYVTDSLGRWLIPITTNASADEARVTWSQDGQKLSFISNASGNGDVVQASDLPIFNDSDSDGIPDIVDVCPVGSVGLGQIDQNFDGCPDFGSSFRFTRFWALDRFPLTIENNAVGDPLIADGSEFTQYSLAFGSWQGQAAALQANFVGGGLENAVSGDVRNSITFTDQDGFLLGTVAITFSTVADDDTTIGGRLFHKNEIIDSDVLFNTQHYAFSTPSVAGPAGSFSLRNVATHELGHFCGFGHSSIQSSTMFYVAYRDTVQTSLERDDIVLARHGYHGALDAPQLSVEGKILRGEDGITPVPGAAVFAITAQDDTVQMTVSGVDGTYRLWNLSGGVRVFVAPLDGTGTVNGLTPSGISAALDDVAVTNFLPEYYDGPTETNADIGSAGLLIQAYPELAANIITNPDLTGPIVVSTSPQDGGTNIPATTTIVVGFSERIAIESVSGSLHLENQSTSTGVAGTAAFLTPSNLLVFTPSAPLDFSTPYLFTVSTDVTDEAGNPLTAPVNVQFTTQAQPPLVILAAAPAEVPIGGTLVLSGTGFSPIAANNLVNFTGGTSATPYAATLEQLFVSVPPGTQSGNINVVVGATSSNDFSIVVVPPLSPPVGVLLGAGTLAGNPRKVSLHPNGAWAYVATSAGVTAVDALPSSANFLDVFQISIAGGTVGVAALPDGQRVLALATNPPSLQVIDAVVTSSFFNTVVQSVPLPEAPLGIAVHPGGTSVLVSYPGRVAAYNVTPGGAFGVEIRQWSQEGVSFLGDISVSPDAAQAYAAASGGKVAVLGLAPGEGVVVLLAAGTTPHETAGSPLANAFFSADETGTVSRFSPRGPLEGSLTEGGSYNGLAVSPDGSFVYALNFTLNRVDVMDAFSITPSLVTSFDTGVDPVDLAVGSGGRYFYVAVDAMNVLEVYDAESGVLLTSVSPRSGGDQTLITVAGSGFDPVPAMNTVKIGDATATVVSASTTALTVLQPGVVSGALRVTAGGENSNPISYQGVDLDETPFVGMGALNETIIPEIETLIEIPGGRWMVGVRVDASMTVIGADPAEPDFLRPVQDLSAAETQLTQSGSMAVTPDAKKLYVSQSEGNVVAVFSLTGPPSAPLSRAGTISSASVNLGASELVVTPDGSRLLVL
ncbi:MAG TPA: Ig-like domain-containing protein, partial [Candidatus Eisenbacteria bacterium]|nr:Ig-like domain-containing protein [Candidatus Eisenbacteria bacterium]